MIINMKIENEIAYKNNNSLSENSRLDPLNDYEIMVQNLEAEVRNHIRVEQQLKLCVESLQIKYEENKIQMVKYQNEINRLKMKIKKLEEVLDNKDKELLKMNEILPETHNQSGCITERPNEKNVNHELINRQTNYIRY